MSKPTRRLDPARMLAFAVLRSVTEADSYANLELATQLQAAQLSTQDAGFATELVAGTLRWQGLYDAIIDQLTAHRLDPLVRVTLRLGAHQALMMRVPDHATVNTTVALCQREIGHRPARLVNAVMRKIVARSADQWRATLNDAQKYSHPAWVIAELAAALGHRSTAELVPLLETNNQPPPVTLVARPGLASVDELPGRADTLSPYGVSWSGGPLHQLPAIRQGRAAVQDVGSQLVALALASAAVPTDSGRWLDMCAGPGGKAALLASLAAPAAGHLVAVERHFHRARMVQQALAVLPHKTTDVLQADASTPLFTPGVFSRILVDAPCTGLGAIRRRPESRWRRSPADLAELTALQSQLLTRAVELVAPGGVVLYATCSPVVAETSTIIKYVVAQQPGIEVEPLPPLLPQVDDAECDHLPGAVQLWPHRHNTDAMFMALLRRR